MMSPHLVTLKKIVAQVRQSSGENFHAYGLKDFLIEAAADPIPSKLLARWIVCFCQDEGKYNRLEPGMYVALQFLYETSTRLPPDAGAVYKKLVAVLDAGSNMQAVFEWASGYYE